MTTCVSDQSEARSQVFEYESKHHDIVMSYDDQCVTIDGVKLCINTAEKMDVEKSEELLTDIIFSADFVHFIPDKARMIYFGNADELINAAKKYGASENCVSSLTKQMKERETGKAAGLFCPNDNMVFVRDSDEEGTISHELGHAIYYNYGDIFDQLFASIYLAYAYTSFKKAGVPDGENLDFLMKSVIAYDVTTDISCADKKLFRALWNEYNLQKYFPNAYSSSNSHEFFANLIEKYHPWCENEEEAPYYAGFIKALEMFSKYGPSAFLSEVMAQYPDLMEVPSKYFDNLNTNPSPEEEITKSSDDIVFSLTWIVRSLAAVGLGIGAKELELIRQLNAGTKGSYYRTFYSRASARFKKLLCMPGETISPPNPVRTGRIIGRITTISALAGLSTYFWESDKNIYNNIECESPIEATESEILKGRALLGLSALLSISIGVSAGILAHRLLISRLYDSVIDRMFQNVADQAYADALLDTASQCQPQPVPKTSPSRVLRYEATPEENYIPVNSRNPNQLVCDPACKTLQESQSGPIGTNGLMGYAWGKTAALIFGSGVIAEEIAGKTILEQALKLVPITGFLK